MRLTPEEFDKITNGAVTAVMNAIPSEVYFELTHSSKMI